MNSSLETDHPFLATGHRIRWSNLLPGRVEPDITLALSQAQAALDAIATLAGAPASALTFDNTILAFPAALQPLSVAWGKVGHLDAVCNAPELRQAYNAMLPKVTEFFARIYLQEPLWTVIRRYAESPAAAALPPAPARALRETILDFQQAGADLPPDKKKRLASLESELASKTQKFGENVLDSTNAWEKIIEDPALLAGLPDTARQNALQSARQKGLGSEDSPHWRFTLHAPSYLPVLKYAQREDLRREFWEANTRIGLAEPWNNTGLLWEILALRHEKALLLGKPHFPDLVLQRRMARSGRGALGFVEDLHRRTLPFFQQEVAELQAYRTAKTGQTGPLTPWDLPYFEEMRKNETFAFDDEALRPWFPLDRVIAGLFELSTRIFGLAITELPAVFIDPATGARTPAEAPAEAFEVWHPEVKVYSLASAEGALLGYFYADWHPREPKRGGAWMNYFLTGERAPGRPRTPHVGVICGNLTPPLPDRPALLDHREVETIFHEFGHLLHHLCGEVEIKSLNGIQVTWDFVELPSQIMENWCWERPSLDLFARHYQTGEPLPEDLFQKMRAARTYASAGLMMRQLAFGKLDLELHLRYADPTARPLSAHEDLDAFIRSWLQPYLVPLAVPAPTLVRRFSHLFSESTGYAAGYYSYKWAEVLEADAFSRFLAEGVLNPATGRDFREKILARGNSSDPAVLFRDFMGRDPDPEALLRRSGLAPASA